MNLGWVLGDSESADADERGVILHEFGHTLGLMHEHQSPVRDQKITLKESAVIDYYMATQGWSKEEVQNQILNVYNSHEVSNYSELDTTSIMMYFMPAAMNAQGIKIDPNNKLSKLDQAFIGINYPFASNASDRTRFIAALADAGVDSKKETAVYNTIVEHYDARKWDDLRFEFTNYCTTARSTKKAMASQIVDKYAGDCASDRLSRVRRSEPAGNGAQHAVSGSHDRLWLPGMEITYSFLQSDASIVTPYRKRRFKAVFNYYSKHCNLSFDEIPLDDKLSANILISYGNPEEVSRHLASWTRTGTDHLSQSLRELSPEEIQKDGGLRHTTCYIRGDVAFTPPEVQDLKEYRTYFHEIGHILGLEHEHDSPNSLVDRDHRIDITPGQRLLVTPWDLDSVMMYPHKPFVHTDGTKYQTGWNNLPSEMDVASLAVLYPFESGDPNDNFVKSIAILGLDDHSKELDNLRIDALKALEDLEDEKPMRLLRETIQNYLDAKPVPIRQFVDGCPTEDMYNVSSASGAPPVPRGFVTASKFLFSPGTTINYRFVGLNVTPYRRKRVGDTFNEYAGKINLKFREEDLNGLGLVVIQFGSRTSSLQNKTGWSVVANEGIALVKGNEQFGGKPETRMLFAEDVVPADEPTAPEDKKREDEDPLPRNWTSAGPQPSIRLYGCKWGHFIPVDTLDEKSVMLYPSNGSETDPEYWEIAGHYWKADTSKYNTLPSEKDWALLGALYPFPKDHGNDKFLDNIHTLGLEGYVNDLLQLRDVAFAHSQNVAFHTEIGRLQDKITAYLNKPREPAKGAKGPQLPARAVAPPSKPTTGSFLDQLVKTLGALFKPTSGQLFALQFPGRFLQKDLYAWDTTSAGIYGQFIKPTVVNESEFRLVDQLYNVGTVIGAPSGINLSIVYEQVLNNLLPGIVQSQINFSKQQDQIRKWLLKDVPTSGWVKDLIASQHSSAVAATTSGPSNAAKGAQAGVTLAKAAASSAINGSKPQFAVANKLSEDDKVNRMELADALLQEYLSAKQAWELERDDMIKNAKGEDMDALTRRLAHITSIREAQLASKHADAVVRGYSHVIRQYLGYMDIKTPAEMLQDAKDALREAATSSLDGSMKIYPVQMQPVDWFQSLSTSFTMEDLTENVDVITMQIDSKSKQLDTLQTRLAILQGKPKIDIKDLQSKVDSAQSAYDKVSSDLAATYSSNVLSVAKTCINQAGVFSAANFTTATKVVKIAEALLPGLEEGMQKLADAQLAVTKASRALTQLMAQKALAEATDTSQEIIETNTQINAITRDIQELTTRVQQLRYQPSPPVVDSAGQTIDRTNLTLDDVPMYPPEKGSSGGSRWQEVYVNHEIQTKYTSSSQSSSAATRNTNVSLFFGSYSSSSSSASASNNESLSEAASQVEVGFRATLVTVDRGGWFQPQFFKQSAGFYSIDPNVTWSKWPSSIDSIHDLTALGNLPEDQASRACEELNKHLLPAFPAGFVICKDITIKIHMSSTEMAASAAEMEAHAASSTGILCFSTSASSSSKSSEKSYGFERVADGCIIRIPGPQILGYILQFTDQDKTEAVPTELPEGFLISDTDYNSSFEPAHAINPAEVKGKGTETEPTPTK